MANGLGRVTETWGWLASALPPWSTCFSFPGAKDDPLWGGRKEILVLFFWSWNPFALDNTSLVVTLLHPKFGGQGSIPFHCLHQYNVTSSVHILLWDLGNNFLCHNRLTSHLHFSSHVDLPEMKSLLLMFIKPGEDTAFQLPPHFRNYFPVIWCNS